MTQTHFGYKDVSWDEKQGMVNNVFHSVADNYDVMNDVMSMGVHRIWKRKAITLSQVRAGDNVLDLASGTGDLVKLYSKIVGKKGSIVMSDINGSMLANGRSRMDDAGIVGGIHYSLINAENIPFPDNHFDVISISFGLRNVRDKDTALKEIYRVLKPGGRFIVLEFSKPVAPGLKPIYDVYSFSILPWMGKVIAKDSDSYKYLAESIRKHPDQETLKTMMDSAGFDKAEYFNLTGGIVAIHRGFKY